jgi:hypothetical protein
VSHFTAVFPKASQAAKFAERLTEPGWWATNVERSGRTVTFDSAPPAGSITTPFEHFADMLDTVGFYGSAPTGRKATLNGVKAPASY